MSEGQKRNKQQSPNEKELQSKILKQYGDEDYGWLKCNTEPWKTSSIFTLQEHDRDKSMEKDQRLSGRRQMPTVWRALRNSSTHVVWMHKLAGSEYVKQHDNALKVLSVKWAIENGLLPAETKWYAEKWESGKIIERG